MPITILSPYSGKPVKVRDQDVGRAIRDEEGRIFYIVETEGGEAYAAMTRKGSDKDLERYRKLTAGGAAVDQRAKENVMAVHDATGKKRSNPAGVVFLLLVLALLVAAVYIYITRPDLVPWLKPDNTTPPTDQPEPGTPDDPEGEAGATLPGGLSAHAVVSVPDDDAGGFMNEALIRRLTAARAMAYWEDAHSFFTCEEQQPQTPTQISPDDFAVACLAFLGIHSAPEPLAVPTWTPGGTVQAVAIGEPGEDPFADYRVMDSGLRYRDSKRGTGPQPQAGSYVEVRYAVYGLDGSVLVDDASQGFVLLAGQAVRALEEGIAGMQPGGQRQLMVPRGHSRAGRLPGLEALPREAFVIDLELSRVRRGVSSVTERSGRGDGALPGDEVELAYEAWVEGSAEPFDSSDLRGRSMRVTLGQGAVIPGLEAGLTGIRPGETRLLTIPPYLAYGSEGVANGLIPPDAVINYRITAESIERP